MKNNKIIVTALLIILCSVSVNAKVHLSSLWGDNMVIQQNEKVLFWGFAKKNSKVTIKPSWSNDKYSAKADGEGKWECYIQTPSAGGPYNITFNDGELLRLENVMLGEVWLCMGQSNMELRMVGNSGQPIENAIDMISLASKERPIRMFTMEINPSIHPQSECTGNWLENTSENVANAGATSYFFADHLQKALNVPVGIIKVAWGGSRIECWMSEEWLTKFKDYDFSYLNNDVIPDNARQKPVYCYNGMVKPLAGLRFKGLLWYQGEANRPNYYEYSSLLPIFVHGMREFFDIGVFPFYYAQIAPLNAKNNLNELMREAMAKTEEKIERCGMISLTDAGEQYCIHPRYKKQAGQRFAYMALGDAYGVKGFEYRVPKYNSIKLIRGNKKMPNSIAVKFDRAKCGIYFKNGKSSNNLEVAGEDKVFYPAEGKIMRDAEYQLIVWSKDVPNPVSIRYAFKPWVEGDIYNNFGIPLSTFRSDDW